jgi:hypothetical protein
MGTQEKLNLDRVWGERVWGVVKFLVFLQSRERECNSFKIDDKCHKGQF